MGKKTEVCVLGLGYIGLPLAVVIASNGKKVFGVEINNHIIQTLQRGISHIDEEGVSQKLNSAISSGNLTFGNSPQKAEIFIIAVPTPLSATNSPDLSYVTKAVDSISPVLEAGDCIILESTSPVGTTEMVAKQLERNGVAVGDISIAYCPERVLPGQIVKELINSDRIIGLYNESNKTKILELYQSFVDGKLQITDDKTAEMVKLAENSFRDVNIAFANELSVLCDNKDINVWDLISLANCHPRVNILSPGAGVGGHCIAVDPWFLVHSDENNSTFIKAARDTNLNKTRWVFQKIQDEIKKIQNLGIADPIVACMGLTFKPNVEDLRESPALKICKRLLDDGVNVIAVEPNIISHKEIKLTSQDYAKNNADLLVYLVKHDEFEKESLGDKTVLDFCGVNN